MSELEAGTSTNANAYAVNQSRKNGAEEIKKFAETIKSVAEQMSESSNEGAREFGLKISEFYRIVAESIEMGQELGGGKDGIAFCTLLAMAKQGAEMFNEGKEKGNNTEVAKGFQDVGQLFGNVAEQIPDGNMKMFSDVASAMYSGMAVNIPAEQPPIGSMANGLLAALKCFNKYPKRMKTVTSGQKATNSRKDVKIVKELMKEAAKAGCKIANIFWAQGEMNTTMHNEANGPNALIQSASTHIQGADKIYMSHINMQIQDKEEDNNKNEDEFDLD